MSDEKMQDAAVQLDMIFAEFAERMKSGIISPTVKHNRLQKSFKGILRRITMTVLRRFFEALDRYMLVMSVSRTTLTSMEKAQRSMRQKQLNIIARNKVKELSL